MNVQPAATFEAVIDTGMTGLAGAIGVEADDNLGTVAIPFTTAGIVELAPGVYACSGLVAPSTEGQYTLIWRESAGGSVLGIEDLFVTGSAPGDPAGPPYVTSDDLLRKLRIRTPTADQIADAERVLAAAKVEIDSLMARTSALNADEAQLVAQVNLERGEELWQETESPWGAIGLGTETGPVFAPRRSRALAKLLPLAQGFGVA